MLYVIIHLFWILILLYSFQFHSLSEGGLAESPLTVSWFAGQKPHSRTEDRVTEETSLENNEALVFARLKQAQKHQFTSQPHHQELTGDSLEDKEALVFTRMKQAQQQNTT